ncbi:MAG: SAM-dependent chlorinase/fluorinase [Alphaproteobacteria bacterium]|nr:SAM-dependent chlorinase/fluorinase [Alphaproteobacteria bacterium]
MIVLFTDFGLCGPYTGQVKAVLHRHAPDIPVIDLFADAPTANPRAAAYLLAAYAPWFPPGTVLLCVVDPGVGSSRAAIVVQAEDRVYVGPDNGLFELVLRRDTAATAWQIDWRPAALSASFHGRDLFAPVAARLARGERLSATARPCLATRRPEWPDDLAEIVYIDHYGNAMTGLRGAAATAQRRLAAGGRVLSHASTFSDRAPGEAFWYVNSNGLIELAVNSGRADAALELRIGSPVALVA